jgi:hypothetical protein
MGVTGSITTRLNATHTKTVGQSTGSVPVDQNKTLTFTDGTGANQVNVLWQDTRVLADAANETLDLAGVLLDGFGTTVALARVKGIMIENLSTDASLIVGAAASPWIGMLNAAGTITIPPGGVFIWGGPNAAGAPVTAGTGDGLKMAHDGTGTSTLTYKISLLGANA